MELLASSTTQKKNRYKNTWVILRMIDVNYLMGWNISVQVNVQQLLKPYLSAHISYVILNSEETDNIIVQLL